MSFALDTPVSKLCFYSIQCTRQKVEKLSAHFLCLLISLGTWSLMRQSSSLMARRHITGMLFTARIYFINHCRWNELLWNPNIYIQTKPNPSADCSWVISQRFWKQKARIICVFLPMSSQDLKGMAALSTTLFESQATQRSLTSPSTLLFRLGLWHLCFYWSCPVHWFLFHPVVLLSVCPKQTAADRWWIKMGEMGQSFRAADGHRGSWVKGSCLIIQGSSLIMSKFRVEKLFLIWHWLKKCFMCYWWYQRLP